MKRRLIVAAVASSCAWPAFTAAASWSVSMPSSVSESAPWRAAEDVQVSSPASVRQTASAGSSFAEFVTPSSVNESAPWLTAEPTRRTRTKVQYASLPNPQTPWSPNESVPARYSEEMRERAQHVASVREARVAVARIEAEQERVASAAAAQEAIMVANAAPAADIANVPTVDPAAPAIETSNAPTAPERDSTRPDYTAGLVDTRSSRAMIVVPSADVGANASGTATSDTTASPASESPVGVTRSEGASASGPSSSLNDIAPSLPRTNPETEATNAPVEVAPRTGFATDHGPSASASDAAPRNAYVVQDSASDIALH